MFVLLIIKTGIDYDYLNKSGRKNNENFMEN